MEPGDLRTIFAKGVDERRRQEAVRLHRSAGPLQISLNDHQRTLSGSHSRPHHRGGDGPSSSRPPVMSSETIYVMEDSDNDFNGDYKGNYDTTSGGRSRSQRNTSNATARRTHSSAVHRQMSAPQLPLGSNGHNGASPATMGGGGNLIYSGWLVKQGKIWKSWKKRYFVLLTRSNTMTGEPYSTLQYYKSHRFAQLKGEITLDDPNTTVRPMDIRKSKRAHCFELLKGFNSLVCQAKDDDDCKQWVEHLSRVVQGSTTTSYDLTKSSSFGTQSAGAAIVLASQQHHQQQQQKHHLSSVAWRQSSSKIVVDPTTRLSNELRKLLVRFSLQI
ncbi:hypothetical protein DYB28_001195 [Aphanomyces astaci]|uniref:PH domain-containing protein n=1 Tax=Aphanomyces astaci TaxID=112090 RepID=A0A9X8EC98_APHAT|nr:hypothetical protein DYB28_001195 [Aphanomyces astaci]